jgi:lantibiotic biosynthesis protein
MHTEYQLMPQVFLRAPFYSYLDYDLLRLPEVLGRQSFHNALYLASPVFYRELEKKGFIFERLSAKEKHTLAKYYNRMCFRPTPFGAFSTFTVLNWEASSSVKLADDEHALLHLLPDQSRVAELGKLLRGAPAGRLVLNPTIYTLGREIRFIRSHPDEKGHYRFSLESVELLPFYTALFAYVSAANPTPAEISGKLMELGDCSPEEAADYLDFLLDSQLLFDASAGRIIRNDHYRDLEKTIPMDGELQPGPFYAAAERPLAEGGLDTALQSELLAAISALEKLSLQTVSPDLKQFISAFEKRYDREKVPLLLALDPDAGIPYAELRMEQETDDLAETDPRAPAAKHALDWEPARRLLFRLWQSRGDSHTPIVIPESDLAELHPEGQKPPTMSVLFRKTEDHLLIEYAGGVTATNLCGRFSVFSPEVARLCREIAAREQAAHPGLIFADIAQLSDTHTDNINRRRPIYDREIAVNTYADPRDGRNLALSDLDLYVDGGELILESRSLGKRIIPRLATAYNYRKTELGIFRLLCDLQYQGLNPVRSLELETLFPGLPFYPRVVYRRTILCPAKWKFGTAELKDIGSGLRCFRERYHLPQRVSMGSADQLLVFDLAIPEEARFFVDCLKGLDSVTLQEYLLPERSVRKGLSPLAAQFTAHLYHEDSVYRPSPAGSPAGGAAREFGIGSEWLYFKLFCTPRTANILLHEVIGPLVNAWKDQLTGWFFIRYAEDGYHLRLRFKLSKEDIGSFTVSLNERLAPHRNLISGLQADTYRRELERYGADLIEDAEALFRLGSELVTNSSGTPPMTLGLFTAFGMICTFFETDEAIAFTEKIARNFRAEFGGTKELLRRLDRRYREQQVNIREALAGGPAIQSLLEQLQVIRQKISAAPLSRREQLLADLVHMQLNRCFPERPRKQEMIVYHHLHKYLVSKKARSG